MEVERERDVVQGSGKLMVSKMGSGMRMGIMFVRGGAVTFGYSARARRRPSDRLGGGHNQAYSPIITSNLRASGNLQHSTFARYSRKIHLSLQFVASGVYSRAHALQRGYRLEYSNPDHWSSQFSKS